VVLTATATNITKQDIFEVLLMNDPYIIAENPNKSNIIYSVHYIDKDYKLDEIFRSILVGNLLEKGKDCERTIIYCQTIKQCSMIYSVLKEMLGTANYLDPTNKRKVLLEMLHSCTPKSNKKEIKFIPES
jgi:superfamily II DNA helicase RecQ